MQFPFLFIAIPPPLCRGIKGSRPYPPFRPTTESYPSTSGVLSAHGRKGRPGRTLLKGGNSVSHKPPISVLFKENIIKLQKRECLFEIIPYICFVIDYIV